MGKEQPTEPDAECLFCTAKFSQAVKGEEWVHCIMFVTIANNSVQCNVYDRRKSNLSLSHITCNIFLRNIANNNNIVILCDSWIIHTEVHSICLKQTFKFSILTFYFSQN